MPTDYNPTRKLLNPDELAYMLDISKKGVYRLIAQRKIRFCKVLGSLRFDRNDVSTFIQENSVEPVGLKQYDSKKDSKIVAGRY